MRSWSVFAVLFGVACEPEAPVGEATVKVEGFRRVVPSEGLPPEVEAQAANNNLDVTVFEGRTYLAFRTAPSHFASPETVMYVVSSTDEQTWRFEGAFARGRDVREPQLVVVDGVLRLYFAELGTSMLDFEPSGMWMSTYAGPGEWTEPTLEYVPGFIPWRIKTIDGRLHMFGYEGGENVYDLDGEPIAVHWVTSEDGLTWSPMSGDDPVVLEGGGSEVDAVELDDGRWVAVVRNEAGDADGFGSKVCTAEAGAPMDWTCRPDPRKFDSPLVIRDGGRVWLVARRTLGQDGAFDLGRDDLEPSQQFLNYQATYWQDPKRCAVWTVDPDTRTVTWVADLASRGDTCFPEAIRQGDTWTLYNYSSDPEGPDVGWLDGQTGPTGIYRMSLTLR